MFATASPGVSWSTLVISQSASSAAGTVTNVSENCCGPAHTISRRTKGSQCKGVSTAKPNRYHYDIVCPLLLPEEKRRRSWLECPIQSCSLGITGQVSAVDSSFPASTRGYLPAPPAMKLLQRGEIGCTAPPPTSLRVLNAVGYVLLIFVNVASQTGLFGPTNAEISRRFSTPLTPAGCGSTMKLSSRLPLLPKGWLKQ